MFDAAASLHSEMYTFERNQYSVLREIDVRCNCRFKIDQGTIEIFEARRKPEWKALSVFRAWAAIRIESDNTDNWSVTSFLSRAGRRELSRRLNAGGGETEQQSSPRRRNPSVVPYRIIAKILQKFGERRMRITVRVKGKKKEATIYASKKRIVILVIGSQRSRFNLSLRNGGRKEDCDASFPC